MQDIKENVYAEIVEKSSGAYICLKKIVNGEVDFYATYINQAFENVFHISKDELEGVLFTTLLEEISFDKENLINLIILVEKTGRTYKETIYSYKYRKYFNVSVSKLFDENICCMFSDMSEFKEKKEKILNDKVAESEIELRVQVDLLMNIKEQLAKKEEMYKYISDASNDGFKYINHKTGYTMTSQKWHELFGVEQNQSDNNQILIELINDEDRNNFMVNYSNFLECKESIFNIEYRLSDDKTWVQQTSILTYDDEEQCVQEVHFYKDITELKHKQLELEYMAYFDAKTKTYNRSYFVDFLANVLEKAKLKQKLLQVMYIDIDNFKKINDMTGFLIGDEIIYKFAKILLENESKNIKIGRFCNDEFVIAIYDEEEESAQAIYHKIIKQLEKPILVSNGQEFFLSISVGVTKYPEGGNTADELIKCADIAMSSVKEENAKSCLMVFEEKMLLDFMRNLNYEHRLKNAVENGDFYLHFQPQYDSFNMKLRGVETLIRWKDEKFGTISPSKFIPMAEKSGCIIEIGTWVIKEALRIYSIWKHQFDFVGIISINISAIQLKDKNFVNILLNYMNEYNLESNDIEIEITESVFIGDFGVIGEILSELSDRGFKISLDDFGTGYSSLSYLKDIPINTLKIDKSFVDSMISDMSTSIITSSVIEMVRKLGLETIAEGVETEEQFKYLRSINCDNIQGFYLGRPMKQEDILKLIIEESKKHD